MRSEPLSEEARSFISTYVHSVRQLELLLHLRERREETWTASRVAGDLRVAPGWAATELDAMRAHGLLAADGSEDPGYRYAAASEEDGRVAELADAYQRRKPTVIQAVLSSIGSDVQALSDAFRLRGPRHG